MMIPLFQSPLRPHFAQECRRAAFAQAFPSRSESFVLDGFRLRLRGARGLGSGRAFSSLMISAVDISPQRQNQV